jgi:hypothetical protein
VFLNVGGLSEHSQVQVEVLTERLEPLPGYTAAEGGALTAAGLRQAVRWQAHDQLEAVQGPIRLRVSFGGLRPEDIRLYAVYVEEAE